MKGKKFLAINSTLITLLLLFAGCASPYQPHGFGGGYSDTYLQDNIYRVSFRGNGYTSRERVSDFALLRSAELALEKGCGYFIILDREAYTLNSTYTTPVTSHTTGSAFASGNMATFDAQTTYSGGQTYNITKPKTMFCIQILNKKADNVMCYDAQQIYNNIRKSYNLNKNKASASMAD